MQLVKASRDALLKPLQVVSGIVERRQTLPILANVLVRKDDDQVSFTATDLEIQIQTSAAIGAGRDAAATTPRSCTRCARSASTAARTAS